MSSSSSALAVLTEAHPGVVKHCVFRGKRRINTELRIRASFWVANQRLRFGNVYTGRQGVSWDLGLERELICKFGGGFLRPHFSS